MTEQRMVPVELLKEIERDIRIHTDATCSPVGRGVLDDLRAIIGGPVVEPFAYYVYFPDAQDGEFCDDLDDLIDRMTNERHEVTPLYLAAPSAPAVPDGSKQP